MRKRAKFRIFAGKYPTPPPTAGEKHSGTLTAANRTSSSVVDTGASDAKKSPSTSILIAGDEDYRHLKHSSKGQLDSLIFVVTVTIMTISGHEDE